MQYNLGRRLAAVFRDLLAGVGGCGRAPIRRYFHYRASASSEWPWLWPDGADLRVRLRTGPGGHFKSGGVAGPRRGGPILGRLLLSISSLNRGSGGRRRGALPYRVGQADRLFRRGRLCRARFEGTRRMAIRCIHRVDRNHLNRVLSVLSWVRSKAALPAGFAPSRSAWRSTLIHLFRFRSRTRRSIPRFRSDNLFVGGWPCAAWYCGRRRSAADFSAGESIGGTRRHLSRTLSSGRAWSDSVCRSGYPTFEISGPPWPRAIDAPYSFFEGGRGFTGAPQCIKRTPAGFVTIL